MNCLRRWSRSSSRWPLAAGLNLRAHTGHYAIRTDLRLVTRILRNFLSNACRYTDEGCILLGARRRGDHLRLEVWDTGRGIAADRLDAIFLEFNQLDVGRASDRKGVGLGLAIVERIAEILGYPVAVRSWPGRGSMFSLEVPISEEMPLAISQLPTQPTTGNPLPGRRLLVLDNEVEHPRKHERAARAVGLRGGHGHRPGRRVAGIAGQGAGTDPGGLSPGPRRGGL